MPARSLRILVVGAGATGGYYGGRLHQAGRDVHFLVRPARAAVLRERGLQIVSPHGDATLHPPLLVTGEITQPFDVVLLSVKAYALKQAIEDFAPAVGPDTMVVPVLNGMRHVDLLVARFGPRAVLGGVSQIATTVDDAGRIVQLNTLQKLAYGERRAGGISDPTRVSELHAAFDGAGFEARIAPDIDREMWEKWVYLATLGGITCLMRGTIGEIEAAPGGAALVLQLLRECEDVATACGHAPERAFVEQTASTLTTPGSGQVSSMYRDLQRGLDVEADQIVGDMLARAQAHGVATPLLATAYAHLRVYQNRLDRARPGR